MTAHHKLRRQVENLTPDEQLRWLDEIASLVRRRISLKHKHRITELEGLAKRFGRE